MHPFPFAGHDFVALRDRAVYWPAHRALLVADLHLEKGSWLASYGQMLPPWDSHATLTRLSALIDQTGAANLWALGDSFHDMAGPGRLPRDSQALLDTIARRVELCWIEGNHDAGADLPGRVCDALVIDDIVLRHESDAQEERSEISGHFHPKVTVKAGPRSVSRPCIAMTRTRLVLPAFGSYTGGLRIDDPAMRERFGEQTTAIVVTENGLAWVE